MIHNETDTQNTTVINAGLDTMKTASIKQRFLQFIQHNRIALLIWFSFRFILLLISIAAGIIFYQQAVLVKDSIGSFWTNRIVGSWIHWDGINYIQVAHYGYVSARWVAFYPLYPILIRGVAFVTALGQVNTVTLAIAGILVSTLAALITCVLLYKLGCLDYDSKSATRSVIYLMSFGVAFYLFAVYTEALFMALALGAFYAARKNYWLLAAILTALAIFTKNQGIILLIALLAEYFQQINWKHPKLDIKLLYFTLPLFVFLCWLAFNFIAFHNPLTFMAVNITDFNRYNAMPWQTIADAANILIHPDLTGTKQWFYNNLINLPFVVAFSVLLVIAVWLAWKKQLRLSYLLYFGGCFLQPFFLPDVNNPFFALPRYELIIFPAFFMLSQFGVRSRLFNMFYLVIMIPVLIMLSIAFSLGYLIA